MSQGRGGQGLTFLSVDPWLTPSLSTGVLGDIAG